MISLDDSNIKALIQLLEDPSELVFNEINQHIYDLGENAITYLQKAQTESQNTLQLERIKTILVQLKYERLARNLQEWKELNSDDLLEGLLIIANFGQDDLDVASIENTINTIVFEVMQNTVGKSPHEIVHQLNQEILYNQGFNGNTKNYSGINNSYINKVFENKISNPIGLSIIYLLVAHKLNLPLIGINSPGHFLLGYMKNNTKLNEDSWNTLMDSVIFYFDPFNNGRIITNEEYDKYLKTVPFKLEDKKLLPASNVAIIRRVLNNLIYALFHSGEQILAQELLQINESLE